MDGVDADLPGGLWHGFQSLIAERDALRRQLAEAHGKNFALSANQCHARALLRALSQHPAFAGNRLLKDIDAALSGKE